MREATLPRSASPRFELARLAVAALVILASLGLNVLPVAADTGDLEPFAADPRYDLTGDGRITYADVMEVVMSWELLDAQSLSCSAPLPAPAHDIDGDGCISVVDVQLVAARIGGITDTARASAFSEAAQAMAGETLTLVVNSTADSVDSNPGDGNCRTSGNVCTLRAAIMEANARPGAENIHFNISGSGVHEIRLNSDLPTISDETGPVVIDGFTQPGATPNTNQLSQGSNAVLRIQIAGSGNRGPSAFRISSANNVIRGLSIYNMYRKVMIAGANAENNVISGSYIGINASGSGGVTSTYGGAFGITIKYAASHNRIGGSAPSDRMVISGNGDDGVDLDGAGTEHNVIQGCIVGLSPDGNSRVRNRSDGLDLNNGTAYTMIGGLGPGEGNVISGNASEGIEISHQPSTAHNSVIGNFIGTNLTGTGGTSTVHRNPGFGVSLEDRASYNIIGPGNVISNNGRGGMEAYGPGSTSNVIFGNKIGVNVNGGALPNIGWGIRLRYHASNVTIGPDNVIAHNTTQGILINDGSNEFNTITRNSIHSNGALGIDLDPIGVNQNDQYSHDGANGRQNFPVITSATTSEVRGTACAGCVVEIFLADAPAGSYGEGKTFLGSATASATGVFTVPLNGVSAGQVITSTATAPDHNTSEFSVNVALTGAVAPRVPGTIQAEDFTSAHDASPGNTGGIYRTSDVDIENCSDPASGSPCYNVGWTDDGEWLEYTVSVESAGWYAFTARVAAANNNRAFRLEVDGQNVTGTVTIPNSGGYQNWSDVQVPPFPLSSGNHTIRIFIERGGFNINYLSAERTTEPANTPPTVAIASPANGATVSGNVLVAVTASDDRTPAGSLDVEVSIDGGAWQDAVWSAASSRFEWNWNASGAPAGQHTIAARATDGQSQTGMAAPVTISIQSTGSPTGPGRFEAEDYTSAIDSTPGNTGGLYRAGDVDIEKCSDAESGASCFNMGWSAAGEWLGFDVSIPSAGFYTVKLRYSTPSNGRYVDLLVDDAAAGPVQLPVTGGYQNWSNATSAPIQLGAGNHTLKLVLSGTNINLNFLEVTATDAPPPPQEPGLPQLPGKLDVEDYKSGGAGVAFNDKTSGNTGGVYRSDDVDIQFCSDPNSGTPCYNVGWTEMDEWLAYDVNVPTAGNYVFTIRYATTASSPRKVRIEIDGVNATGTILLPSTGGFQTWGDAASIPVAIPAGRHTIKLVFENGGPNINYVSVAAS